MATTYNTPSVFNYNAPKSDTGLVVYLDAANPKSWPGSGSVWYDLSGKGNHCALTNSPTFSNGVANFDGTNNYGTITYNSTLDFSAAFTLMMFMRPTGTGGRGNPWDQAYAGYGSWTDETTGFGSGTPYITSYFGDLGINGNPNTGLGSATVPRNAWACMCITRDTAYHKWYKDGTLTYNTAHTYGSLTTTTNNIRIGFGYANPGFWSGAIGTILAYTRTLTAIEVQQNFERYRARYLV